MKRVSPAAIKTVSDGFNIRKWATSRFEHFQTEQEVFDEVIAPKIDALLSACIEHGIPALVLLSAAQSEEGSNTILACDFGQVPVARIPDVQLEVKALIQTDSLEEMKRMVAQPFMLKKIAQQMDPLHMQELVREVEDQEKSQAH